MSTTDILGPSTGAVRRIRPGGAPPGAQGQSAPDEPRRFEAPQVPFSTLLKLLTFTFLMFTLPIYSYFWSRDNMWNGNLTYAALTAAFVANAVVVGYVVVAFLEPIDPSYGGQVPSAPNRDRSD